MTIHILHIHTYTKSKIGDLRKLLTMYCVNFKTLDWSIESVLIIISVEIIMTGIETLGTVAKWGITQGLTVCHSWPCKSNIHYYNTAKLLILLLVVYIYLQSLSNLLISFNRFSQFIVCSFFFNSHIMYLRK